jgi:excisionase family DNA binding protein
MLTVRDVASHLGCSQQTVRNFIHAGRLAASRRMGTPRGAWQISEAALAEFTEATAAAARAEEEEAAAAAAAASGEPGAAA